ncbi:MAG: Holliday junction branch migration protein RuvA [Solirubrobacterales bacterium]
MIAFLRGILADVLTDSIVLDVNGIGYEISVPVRTLGLLPGRGQEVFLFTRMVTTDNDFRLFGFLERQELELFKSVTNVSGIGPRMGLAVLGHFTPDQFYRAVAADDLKSLAQIPGVGKKTAERLVFELKDRVPQAMPALREEKTTGVDELLEALAQLGFSRSEVYPDVVGLLERNEYRSTEENIKRILRSRAGSRLVK